MSEIEKYLPFQENDIDIQNYTLSILQLCSAYGIVSEKLQHEIRSALDNEFIEIARQYTKGESSTLPIIRARQLYYSILYQCDVYLLSLKSTNKAVEMLKTIPINLTIENGKKLILQIFEECRQIFKKAYGMQLDLPVYEYRFIMDKAFDEFCANYSARFDARNICTSIDYPLLHIPAYNIKSQGVLFIKEYYTAIMLENEFCNYFSHEDITGTLESYGKIYNCKYTSLLFNITQILLNNMLAAGLVYKPAFTLKLNKSDIKNLYNKYQCYTHESLLAEVMESFKSYYEIIENPDLVQYIYKYIPDFANEFYNRILNKTLDKFVALY